MTEFMLLKISYTNESPTWPPIQGGVAVCFWVSLALVIICQLYGPVP